MESLAYLERLPAGVLPTPLGLSFGECESCPALRANVFRLATVAMTVTSDLKEGLADVRL